LTRARDQARELQGQVDALATVTANLYAETLTLRRRLRGRTPVAASGDANAMEQPTSGSTAQPSKKGADPPGEDAHPGYPLVLTDAGPPPSRNRGSGGLLQ
jgi:hypothetical protein